jgi:hypothetical protein
LILSAACAAQIVIDLFTYAKFARCPGQISFVSLQQYYISEKGKNQYLIL